MDKTELRRRLLARLEEELAQQTRAALDARDEATSEESKPENQYDMHSQEAAYLAEGQARLAAEIAESVRVYRAWPFPDVVPGGPLALGAVVTLEERDRRTHYFLGPRAGGVEVECGGQTILIVTPASPLGQQLLGKRVGQSVSLPGARGPRPHRIVAAE